MPGFHCRTTLYTEYVILQSIHNDAESKIVLDNFKYNHYRCAWYSYMKLLDINYIEGFCCSQCGSNPDSVIMDGTAISFRQALDCWKSVLGVSTSVPKKSGR